MNTKVLSTILGGGFVTTVILLARRNQLVRFFWTILKISVRVFIRRLFYGPKLPTWTFTFEVLSTFLYLNSLNKFELNERSVIVARKRMEIMGAYSKLSKKIQFRKTSVPNSDFTGEWLFSTPSEKELAREKKEDPQRKSPIPVFLFDRFDTENHPVILYLHGGGYFTMSTKTHRSLIGKLAQISGATILSINYRLIPEHPFPFGLMDALHTYQWLISPRESGGIGISPKNIIISGDSAGGGLTTATVLSLINGPSNPIYRPETYLYFPKKGEKFFHERKDMPNLVNLNLPPPCGVILISPWVDLECKGKSWQENREFCYLEPNPIISQWYTGHSIPEDLRDKIPLSHPLVSPINGDFRNFPPMLIQCGAKETLCDDSVELAKRARGAGVDVTLEDYADMTHVFQYFGKFASPHFEVAVKNFARFVTNHVGKSPSEKKSARL